MNTASSTGHTTRRQTTRRALLVLGPESSGTRLMAQILINAGCAGSYAHEQPFDDETYDLSRHDLIVWRRSVPHDGKRLDLLRMYLRLGLSTDIFAVVMTRDLYSMVQSQIRECQHAECEDQAYANIQDAYAEIFSQLGGECNIPFIVVPYESLVLGSQGAVLQSLGLEPPKTLVPIRNENQKYYLKAVKPIGVLV